MDPFNQEYIMLVPINTFPFSDPERVPHRPPRQIILCNHEGVFPTLPFIGVKPIEAQEPLVRDSPLGRVRHQRRTRYPEVGIGFYWWMGKEINPPEYLGFSPDPADSAGQHPISIAHLWRALVMLQNVPFIDVTHNSGGTLADCWGMANIHLSEERLQKIRERCGGRSVDYLHALARLVDRYDAGKKFVRNLTRLFVVHGIPYRP